jgi:hypothetical protein
MMDNRTMTEFFATNKQVSIADVTTRIRKPYLFLNIAQLPEG